MDWNSANSYEVNSGTIQTAQQNALVGPPPVAATPESVAAQIFQARVALFESSRAAESCMNKHNATFKILLASHRKLAAKHKALVAEHRNKTRDDVQVSEFLKRVTEVQGEKTRLVEQHRDEVARLKVQLKAQAEAHKTEIDGLLAKIFPHSTEAAQAAVLKARGKRDASKELPSEYNVEDYLMSIWTRVRPLKAFGIDMLNASICAFRALWSGEEAPSAIPELAKRLLEVEDRLSDWRESAARVGADEALSFVLCWYDGINLDVLQSMRVGSPFLSDPKLISKRQERAYSFIQYAEVHTFVKGPKSDADEEAAEEEEEEMDKEIVAESPPAATDAPSAGTDDPAA
ncbi:uncharacterized protein LOC112271697 [Brachypodium distachyon]|uniref:uncharacterized protein LOC112271697 n=1 Tax=Brachypodium distachyon TaxID=15368 RepID=UPI000D0DD144|nr:uncharacterized protein LOC112271697 [Brachypodium distachyon]|eukprot:XP_024317228.1 uncharacterized protein LOC112271697 [Brachypodium distachyon]